MSTGGADGRRAIGRALLSVSEKRGLIDLAGQLDAHGVEIIATGSTAAALHDAGIPVRSVEEVTGSPELLDGRVKTLHPKIHAALLADRDNAEHREQLSAWGIEPIDLVVVNLYPFAEAHAAGDPDEGLIEQIDIGGVALIRAAAKNHRSVAVLTTPDQYAAAVQALDSDGFTLGQRQRLAAQAFAQVAGYDVHIANWMSSRFDEHESGWPHFHGATWRLVEPLRYGENPHQGAALYRDVHPRVPTEHALAAASLIQGKAMSFNNFVDADAALRAVADFDQPAVAIIKHTNPCGIAVGASVERAHALAQACDPVSAFGGVIATNRPVTGAMARQITDLFTEVVLAPGFEGEALEILGTKPAIRVLQVRPSQPGDLEMRPVTGGMLMQSGDVVRERAARWQVVCGEEISAPELADLEFAWCAARSVKSNAIVIAAGGASIGIGMGQVNRVDAARLAVMRAGERARGAVAASDAFFPFPDGVEVLAAAGIRAIVQPGGSVRDDEVIAAARASGVTMYLTGIRHFWH